MTACRPNRRLAGRGFTLIEVLVVLSILALMALMSWRSLDAMLRQQQALTTRAEGLQTLQTALSQWQTDLSMLHESPELQTWHWDGQVLRLTRTSPAGTEAAVQVVAWSMQTPARTDSSGPHWMRWQSSPLRNRTEWQQAWADAALWGQQGTLQPTQGSDTLASALALWPLTQWQIFVHRDGAWTNPLSSDAGPAGAVQETKPPQQQRIPDGVRLQLTLAQGLALSGTLQADWVRPVFTGMRP